jgi:sucrose-6-phosphate hydrolase SacC (GH32 family)
MKNIFCALAIYSLAFALPLRAADDFVFADFEDNAFTGWAVQGDAFSKGPAQGDEPTHLEIENWRGNGVASSERDGDGPTGTLTSPTFTINRRYITFLVGGGAYEFGTCVTLIIDGKVVRMATGADSDRLKWVTWDVGQWMQRATQIQLLDTAQGRWGHINVDQITFTDKPETMPLEAMPLYQETHRPQFHFTARQWTQTRLNPGMRQEGWINDLNGLIYYDGEYHLFAQRWAKCWLHAVSRDLIHWEELQPAFWEEEEGSGVQSGTCVIDYANTSGLSPDKNTPPMVAFWSRFDNRSQCLSYSLDKGRTWKRYEKNPLFIHAERDPKVFWHEPSKKWVMMMYGDGKYHILTSPNLLDWHDENNPIPNSYECPDFFELPLDGDVKQKKWVLVRGNGKYSIGTFEGTKFSEETPQYESDGGPNFYATQSWANVETGDGRRIQTAWMRGGQYPDMPFNQQISFPCQLTLRSTPNGPRVFREPIVEIAKLHKSEESWTNLTLHPGDPKQLKAAGDLFHIKANVSIPEGKKLIFRIRGMEVELTNKTVASATPAHQLIGELKNVEILVDRTSIEVFANDGEISLSRCYLPTESGLSVRSDGAPTFQSLKIYELNSIWH